MKNQKIIDYPPANIIQQDEKDYPFIRCENCHELLSIKFNLNKKEIELKCVKEQKIKNIPFEKFFETIDKYKEMNCCELCNKKIYLKIIIYAKYVQIKFYVKIV